MCERASDKRIRVTMDLCASQGRTWTSRALSGTLRCSSQEEQFQLSFFFFFPWDRVEGMQTQKKKDRFSQRASESLSSAESEEPLR